MRALLLSVTLALTTPVFASADENCGNATSQSDMNFCAEKSLTASDAEMNKVYNEIRGRLKGDAHAIKRLVAAQKAWIAFRDAECDFQSSDVKGGSIYPFLYNTCADSMTQARTKDLKANLSCEEGDLGCPVPPAN